MGLILDNEDWAGRHGGRRLRGLLEPDGPTAGVAVEPPLQLALGVPAGRRPAGSGDADPRPHLSTAAQGYWHYLFGKGRPARSSFDAQGTAGVDITYFDDVAALMKNGAPGTYDVSTKKTFLTGNDLHREITLRLKGQLQLEPDNYAFRGQLSAFPDSYDMNPSDHRDFLSELATRAGGAFGRLFDAVDYDIDIEGHRDINVRRPRR